MQERRESPRAEVKLSCTLRRPKGTPVAARTIDVGPGGMSVTTDRPLRLDEVLDFDLPLPPAGAQHCEGRARVLRLVDHERYALRFERLPGPARLELERLAGALSRPPERAPGT